MGNSTDYDGFLDDYEYPDVFVLPGTQSSVKSPVSRRHTLEGEVDATTELVSGKSSGFIGGMRQEKPMADERIDINQDTSCEQTQGHKRIS